MSDHSGHSSSSLDESDTAPGEGRSGREEVLSYVLGLVLAVGLTVASFYCAGTGLIWARAIPAALISLGVAQIGVHLVFFLHITTSPDNTNNVMALAFGVLIVFLLIGGSVWIIGHLNQNMMPVGQMMQMQR